jgi:hypothetical protein
LGVDTGIRTEHKNQGKELWPATAWAGRNVTRNATRKKGARKKMRAPPFRKKIRGRPAGGPKKLKNESAKG